MPSPTFPDPGAGTVGKALQAASDLSLPLTSISFPMFVRGAGEPVCLSPLGWSSPPYSERVAD